MALYLDPRVSSSSNHSLFRSLVNFKSSPGLFAIAIVHLLPFLPLDGDGRLLFRHVRLWRRRLVFPWHCGNLSIWCQHPTARYRERTRTFRFLGDGCVDTSGENESAARDAERLASARGEVEADLSG